MTEQRVRELLTDVADPVPPPDLAQRAWRRSVRVRRRRVAGTSLLAAGVVAAVVAVVGVVGDTGVVNGHSDRVAEPGPGPEPEPVPQAALARQADARVAGAPAWIGPTYEEETRLPRMGSALPGSVDLAGDVETTEAPGPAAAAFGASDSDQLDSVMLLGRDGEVSRLELEESLQRTENDKGDSFLPLNISSLSPDGRNLVFAQQDEVVVYDLVKGEQREFSNESSDSWNVGWTPDGAQIQLVKDLMDPDTGEITPIPDEGGDEESAGGPVEIWPMRTSDGSTARAFKDRPVPKLGPEVGDDPVVITVEGTQSATLVLPTDDIGHISPRSRLVGWLGESLVAFQSQDHGSFHVLAWNTETGAIRLVSDIELPDDWDEGVMASWADVAG